MLKIMIWLFLSFFNTCLASPEWGAQVSAHTSISTSSHTTQIIIQFPNHVLMKSLKTKLQSPDTWLLLNDKFKDVYIQNQKSSQGLTTYQWVVKGSKFGITKTFVSDCKSQESTNHWKRTCIMNMQTADANDIYSKQSSSIECKIVEIDGKINCTFTNQAHFIDLKKFGIVFKSRQDLALDASYESLNTHFKLGYLLSAGNTDDYWNTDLIDRLNRVFENAYIHFEDESKQNTRFVSKLSFTL